MKRLLAGLGSVLLVMGTANAAVIAFDNFDYPDGGLIANSAGLWQYQSGDQGTLVVEGGKALVNHSATEDARLMFDAITSGDVFFGMDFSVDTLAGPVSGGDYEYFIHFKNADLGTTFRTRIDVVAPTGAGDYSIGLSNDGGTANVVWGSDFSYDTTYRMVARYSVTDNFSQLWIGATSEGDTSILYDQTSAGIAIYGLGLRQSTTSMSENIRLDGLVVGTTFNDVVTAIPEPSSLLLIGICGLATVALRRRR